MIRNRACHICRKVRNFLFETIHHAGLNRLDARRKLPHFLGKSVCHRRKRIAEFLRHHGPGFKQRGRSALSGHREILRHFLHHGPHSVERGILRFRKPAERFLADFQEIFGQGGLHFGKPVFQFGKARLVRRLRSGEHFPELGRARIFRTLQRTREFPDFPGEGVFRRTAFRNQIEQGETVQFGNPGLPVRFIQGMDCVQNQGGEKPAKGRPENSLHARKDVLDDAERRFGSRI